MLRTQLLSEEGELQGTVRTAACRKWNGWSSQWQSGTRTDKSCFTSDFFLPGPGSNLAGSSDSVSRFLRAWSQKGVGIKKGHYVTPSRTLKPQRPKRKSDLDTFRCLRTFFDLASAISSWTIKTVSSEVTSFSLSWLGPPNYFKGTRWRVCLSERERERERVRERERERMNGVSNSLRTTI